MANTNEYHHGLLVLIVVTIEGQVSNCDVIRLEINEYFYMIVTPIDMKGRVCLCYLIVIPIGNDVYSRNYSKNLKSPW